MELPIVNGQYTLDKFAGKGGWTYAKIPEILPDKAAPFGWVRVRGSIDNYEIKSYHLMPMGNGCLFLPVKAEIRKKIGKKEGDSIHVVLFKDDLPIEIPGELKTCLLDEPAAYNRFLALNPGEQKAYIEWIYAAKKEDTKIERIAETIKRLQINRRAKT